MRFLYLTQHFSPEVTAARFRAEGFARELVGRGHDVDLICAVPNHPQGAIHPGYEGRVLIRRNEGRLRVRYVWVRTGPDKSLAARAGNYGSYAAAASLVAGAQRRPDAVLATSPPLSVGAAGVLAAARHRAPLVFDVRDLWPKVAAVLGELPEGGLMTALERLEEHVYRRADRIVTVTEPFRQHILERAQPGKAVDVVPNGTTREWIERGERPADRVELGLAADRFIVAYAGNFGHYHALDVAIDAAAELDDSFQLLLIGHGPLGDDLRARAAKLPADRVRILGLMSPDAAAAHLRAADASLVSLRASFPDVLSSKLFDYCAIGRPVVVSAAGETRRVVEEAGAALTVEPESPAALAAGIRELRSDPELRDRLALAGRALALEYLRERQAEVMADILESAARAGRA